MTGTDKGRQRFSGRSDQIFLERDALVALQNWISYADYAVTIANRCGNMTHFVSSRFTLPCSSPKALKCFEKEGFDVMRLQSARFRALHFFAYARNATSVHCVV